MNALVQLVWELLKLVFGVVAILLKIVLGIEIEDKNEPTWTPSEDDLDDLVPAYQPTADEVGERFEAIIESADRLRESIRRDRASEKLAEVLDGFVLEHARGWAARVREQPDAIDVAPYVADDLETVLAQVSALIEQRKDKSLRHALGDADAIAMACYEPIFDFARVNRVPLSSATPVVMLSDFSLAIWTGFAPTGIAPIFLPPDFFRRLAWWPALAHEIGHDFLIATEDAEDKLREQLDLPSEELGLIPLRLTPAGLDPYEVVRVFGGWFEEIFCDVFGTMMIGPAYGWTMIELFAGDAERIARVGIEPSGRYGPHPPRHLRLLICTKVLDLMGEPEAAEALLAEWTRIHGPVESFVYPTQQGLLPIPVDFVESIAGDLVTRLHRDPLEGFDGHSLSAIPGVDYGPHAAAEVRRATEEMLAGRAPHTRNPRVVIAAAVMAWRRQRGRETELLRLARIAIVGVAEWAEGDATAATGAAATAPENERREAFILHTVFAPPPSLARARGRRVASLAARRQLP